MRARSQEKGLPLEVEFVGDIPETILCDPLRLRQILINLVGNAVKFTKTGCIRLVMRLVKNEATMVRMQFEVIDTGIGLTAHQLGKLFQPFTQADSSTTRKFGGTGLGLAISKNLAEMLGGDISVTSEPGKGSAFCLTVEAGSLTNVLLLKGASEAISVNRPIDGRKTNDVETLACRILLAEDGLDNQRLISLLLTKAGAEVVVAENGQVAVELALQASAEEDPFDLILMDMQMPVLDGYDATSRLRRVEYAGPIVALTANAMSGDREKCINAGCDDYMTKPVDRKKLVALVAQMVTRGKRVAGADAVIQGS